MNNIFEATVASILFILIVKAITVPLFLYRMNLNTKRKLHDLKLRVALIENGYTKWPKMESGSSNGQL